ncbi:MAG: DUF3782 domain-containing protein [Candidatus Bathyarchaeia archaeon]
MTLREDVLKLLREDAEFREEAALLLMRVPLLEEIRGLREDFNKRFEAHERRFAEFEKRMEELRGDFNKGMVELREDFDRRMMDLDKRMVELREDFGRRITDLDKRTVQLREDFNKSFNAFSQELSRLRRTLNAIGYRWGFIAEGTFREGMKGLLEKYGLEVQRLEFEDKWGIVHRRVQPVEVDVCIKDEAHTLVEVAASASRGDIELLYRKGELYEKVYGIKPKLVMVSLHPSDEALNLAKAYGITVYTD